MKLSLIPPTLRPIAEKIERDARITEEDALALYRSKDLNALGIMASAVRERKERQRRHLYPQSLYQLFEHLSALLPILRFRGEEARFARL